jgi:hypothetical protein
MSTAQFTRAKLVPFDAGGTQPQESEAIPLDFNPETLTLKVSSGEQRDSGRRGRQQTQNVGASKATLSFECIFDSTRPRDLDGGGAGAGGPESEEQLDVRTRTRAIADLLQVQGDGRDQAPRRVQFRWGTLIFNGVVSSHQETFDYFSPSGVPLRSKVALTLTEQDFRYEVSSEDAARRRAAVDQAGAGARALAAAAGAPSLLGGGPGLGLDLDLSLDFDLKLGIDLQLDIGLDAELGFSAKLGASADIGLAVGAGISLDADAAVDLFGLAGLATSAGAAAGTGAGSAAPGGAGDSGRPSAAVAGSEPPPGLGPVAKAMTAPSPGLEAAGRVPSPWAPEGPAPSTRAAQLAAVVNRQRAAGAAAGGAGLAVRGSPPTTSPRPLGPAVPLFGPGSLPEGAARAGRFERRPRWETLPDPAPGADHRPGCGCRACSGSSGTGWR